MTELTVAAVATPSGYGGIGIVKISGPLAVESALSIFQPKGSTRESRGRFVPESRRMYYGHVVDTRRGRTLDEVMLVVMRAPHSYTGEDVAEIQSHGGPLVLEAILGLLSEAGVCLAEPGEFTKRAFLNGRIDLTQSEAVMELIEARSSEALELAAMHLDGSLGSVVSGLRDELTGILAEIEAAIDFPEEVDSLSAPSDLALTVENSVLQRVRGLLRSYREKGWVREGVRVVIAGSPNAGKSSLLNCLVGRDRAIVTEYPGTTRDLVEDGLVLKGTPFTIVDTAGLNECPGPVERIGIDRAFESIDSADIVLLTVDSSRDISAAQVDFVERFRHKQVIIVLNKSDLPRRVEMPAELTDLPLVSVSAKYKEGIDRLKGLLCSIASGFSSGGPDSVVPNLRQKQSLENACFCLESAAAGLRSGRPFELVSIDLSEALRCVQEVTGDNVDPDILDRIFSRFCIGK